MSVSRAFAVCVALFIGAACSLPSVEPTRPEPASEPAAVADRAVESGAEAVPASARQREPSLPPPDSAWGRRLRHRLQRDSSPLDGHSRRAERNGKRLVCPDVDTERYAGAVVPYHRPLRVHADFRARLERFEQIVHEVAVEIYGRPPAKIRHYGAYNCRTLRKKRWKLSEHAFGNAIDVAGFDFAAAPDAALPEGVDARAAKRFRVRVEKHWDAQEGFEATHARFLRAVLRRLIGEPIFRGMIAPPAPGHHNHFHLDSGPRRYLWFDLRD